MPVGAPINLSNPANHHPLNRGLVAWWLPLPHNSGSTTLFDLVPTGRNHGTLTNGPTWVGGPNGFGALSFDGSNDRVDLPNTETVGTGDFTVVIRTRHGSTAGLRLVFGTQAAAGNNIWIGESGGTGSFSINGSTVGTASVVDGLWRTWVATRVGGTATLYLNGVAAGSGALGGNVTVAGYAIGDFGQTTSFPWLGQVESVMWYPARGVSASEAGQFHDQVLRGYPDLLRRVPTSRSFVGAAGGGGGGGPSIVPIVQHLNRMRRAG